MQCLICYSFKYYIKKNGYPPERTVVEINNLEDLNKLMEQFDCAIIVHKKGHIRSQKPIIVQEKEKEETNVVFQADITHNLGKMAEAAGLYEALWRPEELGITKAYQLSTRLSSGLVALVSDREKYEQYNPENGWGDYDTLVNFVIKYIAACAEYPNATVKVSR